MPAPVPTALAAIGVPRDEVKRGILFVCASVFMFSGFNVVVKSLSDIYPIAERMTQAYRYAPAAAVAPFTYSAIIWATLFGWLVWNDLPGAAVVVGAAIVAASGLYILHRETRRAAGAP